VTLARAAFALVAAALAITAGAAKAPHLANAAAMEHVAQARMLGRSWSQRVDHRRQWYAEALLARWPTWAPSAPRVDQAVGPAYLQLVAQRIANAEVWGAVTLVLAIAAYVDGRVARRRGLIGRVRREPSLPGYHWSAQLGLATMVLAGGVLLLPVAVPYAGSAAFGLILVGVAWLRARHDPWS
jgi:hypothetical protein